MENRLIVFDWMRTVGIFMILLHHLPKYYLDLQKLDQDKIDINLLSFYELNRYFSLGLFVFISGYLINQKRKRFLNSRSLLKFLYKKIIRVFPLYYLALIAFIYMYQVFDPVYIIIHILGLQLFFVSANFSALPTLWFVGLIVIYYSLFMILNHQPIKPIYKTFLILLFPIFMVTLELYFQITDLKIMLYYFTFLFGIFSAETLFFESQLWQKINPIIPIIFGFVFLLSFFILREYGLKNINPVYAYILVNMIQLVFILFMYKICNSLSYRVPSAKLVDLIAYSSYCMYLFHRPLWFLMVSIMHNELQIANQNLILFILICLGLPLLIILSYFLQRFYDKYFMRLANPLN